MKLPAWLDRPVKKDALTETDFRRLYEENPSLLAAPEQVTGPDSNWRRWQGTPFDEMDRTELEAALIQAMRWNMLHGQWLIKLRVAAQKIIEPRYQIPARLRKLTAHSGQSLERRNTMKSTFARAFVGFTTLTATISGGSLVALWALDKYTDGVWWASLLVVLIGLVSVVSVYSSTLHTPIRDWINEPKEAARLARLEAETASQEAQRNR